MDLSQELIIRYFDRTCAHIRRVQKVAAVLEEKVPGVLKQSITHDESKFSEEEKIPYIWLTKYYDCKRAGIPFKYPDGMKEKVDAAIQHHYKTNSHHPECHDDIVLHKSRGRELSFFPDSVAYDYFLTDSKESLFTTLSSLSQSREICRVFKGKEVKINRSFSMEDN